MGLMDRVKAQANQLAQKTQEAAQEGRARIDQAQAARRGDMLLRQLGALVFAERTSRGTAESQTRIDQLIGEISAYETQTGLNLTDPQQSGFGIFGQGSWGQQAPGQPGPGQQAPGQEVQGQQLPGQPVPGEPAPGQPAPGEPGPDSPAAGQDAQGQDIPAQPEPGASFPPQGGAPSADPGNVPPVDTSTNFFPRPEDDS
jgi:hypothetical protein